MSSSSELEHWPTFSDYWYNWSEPNNNSNLSLNQSYPFDTSTGLAADLDGPTAPAMILTISSILMVAACFLLIVVTIGGNTLVILAFHIEPSLQVITNHWIVSLALTDIILAAVVMPLQISRELFDGRWVFGALACDVFISLDVLCCTCSIYHLCLISLDRYFCVRYPISYPRIRTPQATLAAICATWFWCIAISFPRLLGWKDHRDDEYACHMTNVAYMLFSSAVSFYIPLLLICIMYYGIYRVTKAQARKFSCFSTSYHVTSRHCLMPEPNADGFVSSALIATTLDAALSVARPSEDSRSSEPDGGSSGGREVSTYDPSLARSRDPTRSRVPPPRRFKFWAYIRQRLAAPTLSIQGLLPKRAPTSNGMDRDKSTEPLNFIEVPTTSRPGLAKSADIEMAAQISPPASKSLLSLPNYLSDLHGRRERMQKARLSRRRQKQESRAAKVVVIVLAAFVLLWAPFFIVNVVAPLCDSQCNIGEEVWKIVTWMGYCNSAINPFIYTCFNRTFRRAFINVFKSCCRCCGGSIDGSRRGGMNNS